MPALNNCQATPAVYVTMCFPGHLPSPQIEAHGFALHPVYSSMSLQMCVLVLLRSGLKRLTLHFMVLYRIWQRLPRIEQDRSRETDESVVQVAVALCLAVVEPCQDEGSDWGFGGRGSSSNLAFRGACVGGNILSF